MRKRAVQTQISLVNISIHDSLELEDHRGHGDGLRAKDILERDLALLESLRTQVLNQQALCHSAAGE